LQTLQTSLFEFDPRRVANGQERKCLYVTLIYLFVSEFFG
jgi:hypothetical protein